MTRCEISKIDTLVDDDLGCKKIGYTLSLLYYSIALYLQLDPV